MLLLVLAFAKLRMERERAAAVDRRHERPALRAERAVHPADDVGNPLVECGAAQIDRIHAAAEEGALHSRLAAISDAELLADGAARAVASDEVAGADLAPSASVAALEEPDDDVAAILEAGKAPAEVDRYGGLRFRVGTQDRLDELLRNAMWRLGRIPGSGVLCRQRGGVARRRQLEAGKLVPGVAGEVDDVGRVVRRQAEPAELFRESETPVVLHGARLRRVGLRVEGG